MTPFTVRISHNIDVEASVAQENASWLKAVNTKALQTSEFNFVAEYFESKTNTPREAPHHPEEQPLRGFHIHHS